MKRTPTNTRVIELHIPKKEAKWWPRLLKEKGKVHWLKVDFDKWKDEDDSGAEDGMPGFGGGAGGFDLNSYMNQMGGGGGAPDFDGLDDESDGDMPDLEDDDDEAGDKDKKGEEKAEEKENKE
ncbi:CS domain-containing protein [Trichostrongylus colubriformis]|uniref:CS domain-containing protein n=1 Tax=Trichostrongylus colubriformis TaxID=6319 RepID=A0AAN8F3T7_TRICO